MAKEDDIKKAELKLAKSKDSWLKFVKESTDDLASLKKKTIKMTDDFSRFRHLELERLKNFSDKALTTIKQYSIKYDKPKSLKSAPIVVNLKNLKKKSQSTTDFMQKEDPEELNNKILKAVEKLGKKPLSSSSSGGLLSILGSASTSVLAGIGTFNVIGDVLSSLKFGDQAEVATNALAANMEATAPPVVNTNTENTVVVSPEEKTPDHNDPKVKESLNKTFKVSKDDPSKAKVVKAMSNVKTNTVKKLDEINNTNKETKTSLISGNDEIIKNSNKLSKLDAKTMALMKDENKLKEGIKEKSLTELNKSNKKASAQTSELIAKQTDFAKESVANYESLITDIDKKVPTQNGTGSVPSQPITSPASPKPVSKPSEVLETNANTSSRKLTSNAAPSDISSKPVNLQSGTSMISSSSGSYVNPVEDGIMPSVVKPQQSTPSGGSVGVQKSEAVPVQTKKSVSAQPKAETTPLNKADTTNAGKNNDQMITFIQTEVVPKLIDVINKHIDKRLSHVK